MHNGTKNSITIRGATTADCGGILECLALAFAPYRDAYTPEAFLDTVLTAETILERMAQMSIYVAMAGSGAVVGTIACKAMDGGRGHLRGMGSQTPMARIGTERKPSQKGGRGTAKCRVHEDHAQHDRTAQESFSFLRKTWVPANRQGWIFLWNVAI